MQVALDDLDGGGLGGEALGRCGFWVSRHGQDGEIRVALGEEGVDDGAALLA